MIGFIIKDLAMIKSNFKLLGLLIIVYLFLGLSGEMDISFILPFMSVMIMISTFSYDSYNKWDAYAVTLPNGRKNSVKAKYLATFIIIILMTVITTLSAFLITYIKTKTLNYPDIILNMLGTAIGILVVEALMYPFIYKFGLEKARIGIFIVVFGIVIFGGFILNYVDIPDISLNFLENYWPIILIVIISLMLYLSYRISLRINLKKEY